MLNFVRRRNVDTEFTTKEKTLSSWQLPYFVLSTILIEFPQLFSHSSFWHSLSTPYIPRFQLHCLMMAEFVSSEKFRTFFLSELNVNFQNHYILTLRIAIRIMKRSIRYQWYSLCCIGIKIGIKMLDIVDSEQKLVILFEYSFNSKHKYAREWTQVATTLTFRVFFFLRSRVDTNFVNYPYLRNPLSSKHVCMQ